MFQLEWVALMLEINPQWLWAKWASHSGMLLTGNTVIVILTQGIIPID